ncbi:merozoite surface protein 2 isoform X3 [Ochlerotatus camptorhynchus]|uniref:merozoite surface protein 2 isoform X3 n=1 Tax=Ochlerotatus camptorhynchus TaxID=644619 RepID=UPI0031D1F4B9
MISKGLVTVLAVAVLAQVACGLPAPQWLTFKDGKFGVNFGGYHAEAGLGGILTGNTAHGGLSASAGTPHGQQAGAGLGGLLGGNDRTAGGGYAGATAGNGVGASAAFGGGLENAGGAGGLGAEAHAPGVSKKVVKIGQTNGAAPHSEIVLEHEVPPAPQAIRTRFNDEFDSKLKTKTVLKEVHTDLQAPPVHQPSSYNTHTKTVYKKKFISHPHKAHLSTRFDSNGHSGGSTYTAVGATQNTNFWNDIFNIPISTLTAVNQFLNNKSGSGTIHVNKHTEVH